MADSPSKGPPFSVYAKSTNPKDQLVVDRLPLHLVPTTSIAHQCLGHLEGAVKYGPFNWRDEGVSAMVYASAAKRHIDKFIEGNDWDPSGAHELGHALACLGIILDAFENGMLVDDRPHGIPDPVGFMTRMGQRAKQITERITKILEK